VAVLVTLLILDAQLPPASRQGLYDAVGRATKDTPTIGTAALALSIATLTFLSSVARSRLFQSAARSGALTDFATFGWWEGFVSVATVLLFVLLPVLPRAWFYFEAALVLYVLLGLLGLLLRLTHIVYRHAGALAEDDLAPPVPPKSKHKGEH
jgi:hypothetical protein